MPRHQVIVRAIAGPVTFDTVINDIEAEIAGEALVHGLKCAANQAHRHLAPRVMEDPPDPAAITTFPGEATTDGG